MNDYSPVTIWIVLVSLISALESYQGPSNRLTRYLLAQHQSASPPDGKIIVSHEIELVHIINVDELKQLMEVLVYIDEVRLYKMITSFPNLGSTLESDSKIYGGRSHKRTLRYMASSWSKGYSFL